MNYENTRRNITHLRQLMIALFLGFLLIALALTFWSVLRAKAILARDDNPRLVETELRIKRGAIVDRSGVVLAQNGGTAARQQRQYPIPTIGPAVGYYSFRHGTAGVEESYDAVLRGDGASFWLAAWRETLHRPQQGQAVQLTLDATIQQQADDLLADYTGALLLLELDQVNAVAPIRALVSHPGYDPNLLDEQFDVLTADESAPLLNRVTQGQYQPGLILQPFLLASALDAGVMQWDGVVDNANRPVPLNGTVQRCAERPPDIVTWADVLTYRCPGPMQDLGTSLDTAVLSQVFADWGFTQQPLLPLNTETPTQEALADAALAVIGQDTLTVTPLQVAAALAALVDDGRFPILQLVTAVQDEAGEWVAEEAARDGEATAVSANAARDIRRALPTENGIAEHRVLVLSGPEGSSNGWYLALYPAALPRYILVVVVENSEGLETAVGIGRTLLSQLP